MLGFTATRRYQLAARQAIISWSLAVIFISIITTLQIPIEPLFTPITTPIQYGFQHNNIAIAD